MEKQNKKVLLNENMLLPCLDSHWIKLLQYRQQSSLNFFFPPVAVTNTKHVHNSDRFFYCAVGFQESPITNAFHCIISYLMSVRVFSGTTTAPHFSPPWETECLFNTIPENTYSSRHTIQNQSVLLMQRLLKIFPVYTEKCTEINKITLCRS